ncbi:MAG: hypothetical protein GY829_13430 [Gammaproteobacteria bacterium]|nr:hypothetical protein [Gammaproteobacteria bacterium]
MKRDKYDKTISELIVASADYTCEICGIRDGTHQCMHDISRTYVITRYDSRNLICGCAACHFATMKDPYLHAESFKKIKGVEENQLNIERARSGDRLKPFEKDEIRAHWQSELKRINKLRLEGVSGKIELEIPAILL